MDRDPSQPAESYRGITKSLTIVYFKEDKPMVKKNEADKWDREKDAEKEYEYAQIQKRLSAIEKEIEALDEKIKDELENKEKVIARIHEAAKYVPLDRLYLSPQCGFASCEIGNKLTEEEQWAKLKLVKEIADEVWSDR